MINKKLIENLRKDIKELERNYQDWKEHGYHSIEDYVCEHIDNNDEYLELKAKLSSTILVNNNCLEDVGNEVERELDWDLWMPKSDVKEFKIWLKKKINEMKLKGGGS